MKTALFFVLLTSISFGQSPNGSLKGVVFDDTGDGAVFVKVVAYSSVVLPAKFDVNRNKNKRFKGGCETDFDGNFNISQLPPGTYDIEVWPGLFTMDTVRFTNIEIQANKTTVLNDVHLKYKELISSDFGIEPSPMIPLNPFELIIIKEIENYNR